MESYEPSTIEDSLQDIIDPENQDWNESGSEVCEINVNVKTGRKGTKEMILRHYSHK